MSYDISLYVKSFLDRALATGLGDWTGADPIPEAAAKDLVQVAAAAGFTLVEAHPRFVEFVREQGVEPAKEFELDTPDCLAHLRIHRGQLAFTIPYSQRADASIDLCSGIAKDIAHRHTLGYWDPQRGETD